MRLLFLSAFLRILGNPSAGCISFRVLLGHLSKKYCFWEYLGGTYPSNTAAGGTPLGGTYPRNTAARGTPLGGTYLRNTVAGGTPSGGRGTSVERGG
jgi:hypothetical protein